MSIDEVALAAEVRGRHGVTTRRRLRRLGMSDRVIDRLISSGRLMTSGRGVLTCAATPNSFEQRVAAACALTSGAASFPTAGLLWGLRKSPRTTDVHVMVDWTRRVRPVPGVALHRTTALPANDVVRRRDGIVLTSPLRTVFDAAAFVVDDDLESMLEQAVDRGHFTIPTLWALTERVGGRGRAGTTRMVRVLARRQPWRRAVESDHELRLERALRQRGFPVLTRRHPIAIGSGSVIHPDLGIPDDRFFIEVDHLSWHGGRLETAYDRWRDLKLRALGCHVERVTDLALDRHLAETVEDLWTIWRRLRERQRR